MTMTIATRPETVSGTNGHLQIAIPDPGQSLTQDAEWCVVRIGDEWQQIRFHDYDELFSVPGLYEKVIYEILECRSPQTLCDMLSGALCRTGTSARTLRVLDLGAGNGMMGERLADLGAELVVGVDIIEEAAMATERDRPGLYDNYHVVDMTKLNQGDRHELGGYRFNCLTCIAALGFGDIPPDAFTAAFDLIEPDGWIVFNIKEDFLELDDSSGFARLVRTMVRDGRIEIHRKRRYPHRLGIDREPIHYVGIVARKRCGAASARA